MTIDKMTLGSAIAAIMLAASGSAAVADSPSVLPAATSSGYSNYAVSIHHSTVGIAFDQQQFSGTGGGSLASMYNMGGEASSALTINAEQFVSTSAFGQASTPTRDYGGGASGTLTYYVGVFGPDYALVPLTLKGFISATATKSLNVEQAHTYSRARFALDTFLPQFFTGGTSALSTYCQAGSTQGCGRFDFDATFSLPSYSNAADGRYAKITLSSSAFANADSGGFANADSIADPIIGIDPVWQAANPGYRVIFSSGIFNAGTGAVPEISTWLMMIFGFGMIGAAMRVGVSKPKALAFRAADAASEGVSLS